ncbi:MAG: glycosyltransferase family 4 protein [Actinomycetes bacterium]
MNSLALGGSQINAVDLAAATAAYGYDSVLVGPRGTLPEGPSLFDIAEERGVHLETFERPIIPQGARDMTRGVRDMIRLAAVHKCDLVHVYATGMYRPAYWGPCRFGRRPWVLTVYEMTVHPQTPRGPSLIVGTEYLLEEQSGRSNGVALISPPVDLERDNPASVPGDEFINALGIPDDHLRVVMVTRLDGEMKELSVALTMKAVDRLAQTGVDLIVVGTGDAEPRLRRLAEAINQRHGRRTIVLAGAMADPRPAYSAADIVVGMGGSAARALAFGKPLVVCGEAGWFRTFEPASAAALFRNSFWSAEVMPNPVEELMHCLSSLIHNPKLRTSLGEYGRNFATDRFGLPAMAERLAGVYAHALDNYRVIDWWRDLPSELGYLRHRVSAQKLRRLNA